MISWINLMFVAKDYATQEETDANAEFQRRVRYGAEWDSARAVANYTSMVLERLNCRVIGFAKRDNKYEFILCVVCDHFDNQGHVTIFQNDNWDEKMRAESNAKSLFQDLSEAYADAQAKGVLTHRR